MELMWTGGLGCICYLMAQVVAAWLRFFASQIFGTAKPEKTSNLYMCHVFWDVNKRKGICCGDAKDFKEAAARAGYAVRVGTDAVDGRAGLHVVPHGAGVFAAWLSFFVPQNFGTATPVKTSMFVCTTFLGRQTT